MNPSLIAAAGLVVVSIALLLSTLRVTVRWRHKVADAERERDVANVMKNDFVAMVSHELRTPLTSIAGFAETLEAGWRDLDPGEIDEFLEIITKQAQNSERELDQALGTLDPQPETARHNDYSNSH